MRLDDPLDETQTEPGALNLRVDDGRCAVERIENPGLIGGGDANAAFDLATPPAPQNLRGPLGLAQP
jgi:hypothetical protein